MFVGGGWRGRLGKGARNVVGGPFVGWVVLREASEVRLTYSWLDSVEEGASEFVHSFYSWSESEF